MTGIQKNEYRVGNRAGLWQHSGMTAEQILAEITLLPAQERRRVFISLRKMEDDVVPDDFMEALADFDAGRFVSMELALNQDPAAR